MMLTHSVSDRAAMPTNALRIVGTHVHLDLGVRAADRQQVPATTWTPAPVTGSVSWSGVTRSGRMIHGSGPLEPRAVLVDRHRRGVSERDAQPATRRAVGFDPGGRDSRSSRRSTVVPVPALLVVSVSCPSRCCTRPGTAPSLGAQCRAVCRGGGVPHSASARDVAATAATESTDRYAQRSLPHRDCLPRREQFAREDPQIEDRPSLEEAVLDDVARHEDRCVPAVVRRTSRRDN